MKSDDPQHLRPVTIWLLTGCALITCMVMIGGITRLTGSGLSITEWKPIMGALPPMGEAQWQVAFEKYKTIPEYALKNQLMDLAGFKRIFFWEYLHRNWGRLMGLVFAVPFVIFWRRGLLKGWLRRRGWAILIGGGLVGALGWFMVASGLEDNPDVSHYRLAIHLCAAFSVFALVLWTVFDIRNGRRAFASNGTQAGRWARWLLLLLVVQIIWGAFTAGLDAGRIYNTWPLMNGEFMPENVTAFGGLIKDFTDHPDGVQFVHRNLAWLVAAAFVGFALRHRKEEAMRGASTWLLIAVLVQFVLGVFTVLSQVEIHLGVLHQLGALFLLTTLLNALHRTGRPISACPEQGRSASAV
ncbi:MAG TPA: COX15/CtaA family protein [Flavobacteriales bacterium]|nr:COX15/CtaA family protein [Flavobacteriales bacterium]